MAWRPPNEPGELLRSDGRKHNPQRLLEDAVDDARDGIADCPYLKSYLGTITVRNPSTPCVATRFRSAIYAGLEILLGIHHRAP